MNITREELHKSTCYNSYARINDEQSMSSIILRSYSGKVRFKLDRNTDRSSLEDFAEHKYGLAPAQAHAQKLTLKIDAEISLCSASNKLRHYYYYFYRSIDTKA